MVFYSIALPFGVLALGIGAIILYWSAKQNELKEVAKSSHSLIDDDSVPETISLSSVDFRR